MDQLASLQKTKRMLLIIMIVTMIVCGGGVLYFTQQYLEAVLSDPASPTHEKIQQVGLLMVVVSALAGLPAIGFGAYVMYLGSRVRVTGQWPPAGMGFQSPVPVMLGDRAGWIGAGVMGLGLLLIVAGLGLPIFGWQLGQFFQ